MTAQSRPVNSICEIFRMPVLIGIVSLIGFASALFGDGIWDVLSWIALGVPVAAAMFYGARRTR